MADRIGIIGVGEIATAMVEGWCTDPDRPAPEIVLSPRSTAVSARLASEFDSVTVASDNQGVVDACDVLVLAVPPSAVAMLGELDIPEHVVLLSVIAGVSHDELRTYLTGPVTIVRAIPMPSTASRTCVTAVLPGHPVASALFDRLGGAVAVDTDEAFGAFAAASATMASHMLMIATIGAWVAEHGVDRAGADAYVRGLFVGAGHTLATTDKPLDALVTAHETVGGLNEQLRTGWFEQAVPDLRAGLDGIYDRVRADD